MTVAETRATIATDAPSADPAPTCPECRAALVARHPRAIFCSAACSRAFHLREATRGRQLLPFQMASYLTRGGSRGDVATGKRARADAEHLIRNWKDEDVAAGRMSMVDYVARRYALGFDRS